MKVVEYRIPMPVNEEEYHLAHQYMVCKTCIERTAKDDGEGVKMVATEEYNDPSLPGGKGVYRHKQMFLGKEVPRWARAAFPAKALLLDEYSWTSGTTGRTQYSFPYLGKKFELTVDTHVVRGYQPEVANINNLSPKSLKARKVRMMDIAGPKRDRQYDPTQFTPSLPSIHLRTDGKTLEEAEAAVDIPRMGVLERMESMTSLTSNVSAEMEGGEREVPEGLVDPCLRGPLGKDWIEQAPSMVTVYKTVKYKFAVFGFQTVIEKIIDTALGGSLLQAHCMLWCLFDGWALLKQEDITAMEEETAALLEAQLAAKTLTTEGGAIDGEHKYDEEVDEGGAE